MASQTMGKMEKVLAKTVAKPATEIVAELQGVARSDPKNPLPHVAMAIVTGFSRHNLDDSKEHLANAEKLLKAGAGQPHDLEWEFTEALFEVVQNEEALLEERRARPPRGGLFAAEADSRAAKESHKALQKLGPLANRLKESELVTTIYHGLLANSLTSKPGGGDHQRGMSQLAKTFRSREEVADLAGFFLMYGHRKARDHGRAIEVGEELVKHNPASTLPKMMLGSAHFFAGDLDKADKLYKKAVAEAPNNPYAQIGYARVLEKRGKKAEAKEMANKARSSGLKKLN
jgi:tetratricopeptide (TPR) repeat protein